MVEVAEVGTDLPDLSVPAGFSLDASGDVESLVPCAALGVTRIEVTTEPSLEEALKSGGDDVVIVPIWSIEASRSTAPDVGSRIILGDTPDGYLQTLRLSDDADLQRGRLTTWIEYGQVEAGQPISLQGAPYDELVEGSAYVVGDLVLDEVRFLGDDQGCTPDS